MTRRAIAERGHWSAWRVLATIPAAAGSSVVILLAAGGLGGWAVIVWLGCGALTLCRAGERCVIHLGWGFRRLGPADRAVLEPVWMEVLERTGVPDSAVDLYVQRGPTINAYAVGGCSVAASAGLVHAYRDGVLDRAGVAAVLAHELGHHETGGARYIPFTLWLALPMRLFYRAAVRICSALTGQRPTVPAVIVVVGVFVDANVQAARENAWRTVVVLSSVAVVGVVASLIDAALSRSSERAADRFAARAGYGNDLARTLSTLDQGPRPLAVRILARHPSTSARLKDLSSVMNRHGRTDQARGFDSRLAFRG